MQDQKDQWGLNCVSEFLTENNEIDLTNDELIYLISEDINRFVRSIKMVRVRKDPDLEADIKNDIFQFFLSRRFEKVFDFRRNDAKLSTYIRRMALNRSRNYRKKEKYRVPCLERLDCFFGKIPKEKKTLAQVVLDIFYKWMKKKGCGFEADVLMASRSGMTNLEVADFYGLTYSALESDLKRFEALSSECPVVQGWAKHLRDELDNRKHGLVNIYLSLALKMSKRFRILRKSIPEFLEMQEESPVLDTEDLSLYHTEPDDGELCDFEAVAEIKSAFPNLTNRQVNSYLVSQVKENEAFIARQVGKRFIYRTKCVRSLVSWLRLRDELSHVEDEIRCSSRLVANLRAQFLNLPIKLPDDAKLHPPSGEDLPMVKIWRYAHKTSDGHPPLLPHPTGDHPNLAVFSGEPMEDHWYGWLYYRNLVVARYVGKDPENSKKYIFEAMDESDPYNKKIWRRDRRHIFTFVPTEDEEDDDEGS